MRSSDEHGNSFPWFRFCEPVQNHGNRFGLPDVRAVFTNCPVGGKLAHAGHIENGHASPALLAAVGFVDQLLSLEVRLEVGEEHERVVVEERIHQGLEQVPVAVGKMARTDAFDNFLEFRVVLKIRRRVVSGFLMGSHLFPDFDVGSIQGSDREGPIHGKLHVAGPGGFLAGGGNLFRQVGGGIDEFCVFDVETREEKRP